jgi:Phage integrase family
VFRAVARTGKVWGLGIWENVVWYVVRSCCQRAGLEHIAPHDLRRTCAKLCHTNGGELEQIQFLLGHASVLTTERYLGCKQNLGHPVNDLFDLKTDEQPEEASPAPAALQASVAKAESAKALGGRNEKSNLDLCRNTQRTKNCTVCGKMIWIPPVLTTGS